MLALPAGACSFSYQLGSLFGQDTPKPEVTGAVAARPVSAAAPAVASANGHAAAAAPAQPDQRA